VEHVAKPFQGAGCTDPFVSVVTVSLDAAATIEDTIASVSMQQVVFSLEHVCVDGGSADGTRAIIDRWAARSERIRRVYEADTGIFDAMNKGLRAARGEYVLFLNADDFLVSADTVAKAMQGLTPQSPDNPDLVVGDVAMGRPGRRGVWRRRYVPRVLPRLRGCGLYPPHQGMFAKRRLLVSVGGFDAHLRFSADLNQYYDLERQFRPSMRLMRSDVAFMRAGGAANSGLRPVLGGSVEIYRHLRPVHGAVRAAAMVLVKSLQSLAEVRYGTSAHRRWFSQLERAVE
jgi:glycosyltransferase involved in cell wall biosynthesis